jgi:hypothetical protein
MTFNFERANSLCVIVGSCDGNYAAGMQRLRRNAGNPLYIFPLAGKAASPADLRTRQSLHLAIARAGQAKPRMCAVSRHFLFLPSQPILYSH